MLSPSSWLVAALVSVTSVLALSQPACQQSAAPNVTTLNHVRTSYLSVPKSPFGIVYGPQGKHAFVALSNTLGVLDTSSFTPKLLYEIPLPEAYVSEEGALGITLTTDGRHIILSAGPGAIIVSTAKAVANSADAVVGTLNATTTAVGATAIEVTVSHDDSYVFVSQEYGSTQDQGRGNIEVFHLTKPASTGAVSGTFVGFLPLGDAVVGTALSPDGRILYALSEATKAGNSTPSGALSIINATALKTDPSKALLYSTPAGCQPVRVLASSDGKTVWVAARESNHLLAFNATALRANKTDPIIASIEVGTAPVGLTWARDEARILTADSNRFDYPDAITGISVVDVHAALHGGKAVLGRIPTGLFPREFGVSPDGKTILVSDNGSNQIQAVDVTTLP